MAIAVYPGSFDPITYGHIDIIERASKMVDKLYVAVLVNSSKKPLFTTEERVEMIREVVKGMPNVEVCSFSGLTVEFAKSVNASVMVRGLRAVTDFEYELQLSQTNRKLAPEIDTIFLTTNLEYAYLSSSTVKEVAAYKGNIDEFVPGFIADLIHEKINNAR